MSDFDEYEFRKRVEGLSDDELIALVSINARNFVPEAMEIAKRAVESRGLANDIQNVIVDVFLNCAGFAGRLILLDEQIMFLSTGLRAVSGKGGGGLLGFIGTEGAVAERNVAAKKMDFSALDNEGSWIYYLDQVQNCAAKTSLLGGKELLFEVREEDGRIINGTVKCGDLYQEEFDSLPGRILEARGRIVK